MNHPIIFANEYMLNDLQNLKKINNIIRIRMIKHLKSEEVSIGFVCRNNGETETVWFVSECVKWRVESWDEAVFGGKWINLNDPLLSFFYDEETCYMTDIMLKLACCRALSLKGVPCDIVFGKVETMIKDLSKYYSFTSEYTK